MRRVCVARPCAATLCPRSPDPFLQARLFGSHRVHVAWRRVCEPLVSGPQDQADEICGPAFLIARIRIAKISTIGKAPLWTLAAAQGRAPQRKTRGARSISPRASGTSERAHPDSDPRLLCSRARSQSRYFLAHLFSVLGIHARVAKTLDPLPIRTRVTTCPALGWTGRRPLRFLTLAQLIPTGMAHSEP